MRLTSLYSFMRPFFVFIEVIIVFLLTVLVRLTSYLYISELPMLFLLDGKIPVLIYSFIVKGTRRSNGLRSIYKPVIFESWGGLSFASLLAGSMIGDSFKIEFCFCLKTLWLRKPSALSVMDRLICFSGFEGWYSTSKASGELFSLSELLLPSAGFLMKFL